MSFIHNSALAGASGQGGVYEIEQSLRFRGSQWLSRTPGSNGNRQTYTHSVWIKKEGVTGTLASAGSNTIFSTQQQSTQERFRTGNSETTGLAQIWNAGGKYISGLGRYTDPAGWYHLVAVFDSTEASSGDRLKIYLNGKLLSTGSNATISLNQNWTWNSTLVHHIGKLNTNDGTPAWDTDFAKFYMAEYHMVDGSALDHEDFGEFDSNGVWRPIEYTGSYGTNGFYLKFDPSATNGIGHDHSGNGNNWTASNFTTSGTGTDVMSDTPTTNWCTLNPLDAAANNGIADGNLKCGTTTASNTTSIRGTQAVSSGKWYFEVQKITTGTINIQCGWAATSLAHTFDTGDTGVYGKPISGTTVMIAADFDNNAIWTGVDGTWDNSATTAEIEAGTTTNATHTGVANYPLAPMFLDQAGSFSGEANFNFGQRAFAHTPPTGFKALNTSNLPAPDIKDGSNQFKPVIYTGSSPSDTNVTGVGFKPGFTWIKARTQAYSHALYDEVRGATNELHSDTNDLEDTDTNGLKSFDPDGFTVGSDGEVGDPTGTRISWNWKGTGTSGSANTAGSIESTVSVNAAAGFSIVTYTGTGVNATVGHGLDPLTPSFYVVKPRSYSNNWPCWHKDLTSDGYYIHLNHSLKQDLATAVWNGTGPSNTVFNIGTNTNVNQLDATFVAYVFAEVEGYSKISSWAGNGSTDGPFVHCGFRPAFLLLKNYRGGSETDWIIQDSTRSTYNVVDDILRANTNQIEASGNSNFHVDFLSNGFKIRTSSAAWNESGSDYLFLAFAENPFGGSGVSPATAR